MEDSATELKYALMINWN